MAFIIDYGVTGADQFVSKTKQMTGSVKALNGAWKKYQTSASASFGKLAGVARGAGSGGGLIGQLVAFSVVGKVMDKLLGGRIKDFVKDAASDIGTSLEIQGKIFSKDWKKLSGRVSSFMGNQSSRFSKFVSRMARISRLAGRSFLIGKIGRLPYLKTLGAGKALGAGVAKHAGFIAAGATYLATKASKIIGPILNRLISGTINAFTKSPLGFILTAPLTIAMLDSRVQDWVNKKISTVVTAIGKGLTTAVETVGNVWDGFTVGMARIFQNAYYAKSQVNWGEAANIRTPAQQKWFMASERERLEAADMEEFVGAEMKRMKKYFEEENEKRNAEIGKMQDTLIKQGRL